MKPKMILSLPSHGTDWLAHLITAAGGFNYYDKEFFNPICNLKYYEDLKRVFGCELVDCYRQITLEGPEYEPTMLEVLSQTWANEPYNFDKENYSLCKAGFFANHFDCVFVYRSADSVFPAKRLRVYQWYDAIWNALKAANFAVGGRTLQERCRAAHQFMWARGFAGGRPYGIPTIDYDVLVKTSPARVLAEIRCLGDWGVDTKQLCEAILDTRIAPNYGLPSTKP
jgi:hypothetical protein